MRIVSLVPSLTELLFAMGLGPQVVGITYFCIHPKNQLKGIKKIGGTKTLKIDRVIDLNPDLVIANKEENSKSDIEILAQNCNVWVTDIISLSDAYNVILELGNRTQTSTQAKKLVEKIQIGFNQFKNQLPKKKVLYLIWDSPMMAAGHDTFINSILEEINWSNILPKEKTRYPELSIEQVIELFPEYILLSSEPFPFKEKQLTQYRLLFPNSKIILVNGEMFSWYGSRLLLAPNYFKKLINSML